MQAKTLIHKIATTQETKSYLIQVLEAFQNMDYHKLNDLLDEECYYDDMKKTAYIYQQMQIFKELRKKGDTHLRWNQVIESFHRRWYRPVWKPALSKAFSWLVSA